MTTEVSSSTKKILVAHFFQGVGKNTLFKIASSPEFIKSPDAELGAYFPELNGFGNEDPRYIRATERATKQLERAKEIGAHIIGFWDSDYPPCFRVARNAPAIFWYLGNVEALRRPTIGVIGTRQPTHAGEIIGYRIGFALAEKGFSVVSGLALGVDATAHRGAVEASGSTIAVLPAGVDNITPRSNAELADSMLENGGLLSEFPLMSHAFTSNFITRDATQSALSTSLVLVQSGKLGGSLHATRATLRLGRKLFVVCPISRESKVPNVEANRILLSKDKKEIEDLLGFLPNLEFIHSLSGTQDYPSLLEDTEVDWIRFRAQTQSVRRGSY